MNYEIQIFAKDKTKIIRFQDNQQDVWSNKLMVWEDYYYAMGAVIDDKADKVKQNNTLIGRLEVRNISFDEIVDVMCEDLSIDLTNILTEDKEVSFLA